MQGITFCKEKHLLTDYFSRYKLNKTSTPFHEEKNSPKLRDCQFFSCNQSFGVFKHWCSLISERKKSNIFFIFYTCIPEMVNAYHTGSPFTQHYYVCRVQFVLKYRYNQPVYKILHVLHLMNFSFVLTSNLIIKWQTRAEVFRLKKKLRATRTYIAQ